MIYMYIFVKDIQLEIHTHLTSHRILKRTDVKHLGAELILLVFGIFSTIFEQLKFNEIFSL